MKEAVLFLLGVVYVDILNDQFYLRDAEGISNDNLKTVVSYYTNHNEAPILMQALFLGIIGLGFLQLIKNVLAHKKMLDIISLVLALISGISFANLLPSRMQLSEKNLQRSELINLVGSIAKYHVVILICLVIIVILQEMSKRTKVVDDKKKS